MNKNDSAVKYSIMLPCYNGVKYLPTCIQTILDQNYSNYELIVSDDNSSDNTKEYLHSLDHPNIKILFTDNRMSMAEHWEWVLSHARGEWLIFVGQDDGVQPYFFELADILTAFASKKRLRSIYSRKAYYFWPGCENIYDARVSYEACPYIEVHSLVNSALKALCVQPYYDSLPHMYTTSLFHKDIISEVRRKQGGKIFRTHPQDANLAAIACSVDSKCVFSGIPLGWVGTSLKSAGLAMRGNDPSLKRDYMEKVLNSKLEYSDEVGSFNIASCSLYFWGALLQTKQLRSRLWNKIIFSRLVMYIVFSSSQREILQAKDPSFREQLSEFKKNISKHNINLSLLKLVSILLAGYRKILFYYSALIVGKRKKMYFKECISVTKKSSNNMSMIHASEIILAEIKNKKLLTLIK